VLERARVTVAGRDLGLKTRNPPAGDVSNRTCGEAGATPVSAAAISASRSERASARSDPTVRYQSLPARRQQTAYLPLGNR
jgi:hypothetical protein